MTGNKRVTDPAQIAALMAGRQDQERQLAEPEAQPADDAGQLAKLMDRPVPGVTALTPWPGGLAPPGPPVADVPAEP